MPRQWLLNRLVDPVEEPVRREELEEHLRIVPSDTGQYNTLVRVISQARAEFEAASDSAILTQVWALQLPCVRTYQQLPKPPLVSVDTITYKDADNVQQIVPPEEYMVHTTGTPGLLTHLQEGAWLSETYPNDPYPWTITFTCGYASPAVVPADIRGAILVRASDFYETRLSTDRPISYPVNHAFDSIVARHTPQYHLEELQNYVR